ncbi:MAG: hypothetical protein WCL18_06255 [bacterium]
MEAFKDILKKVEKCANAADLLTSLIKAGYNVHPEANNLHQPRLKRRKVTEDEIIQVFECYKFDGCPEIAYLQIIGKKPIQINEHFWVCK